MIEVKHVTKVYGSAKAVDDVSFSVKSGEILGFLGPNGAGKSTTMNIITGYISSSSGTVTVDGCEILDDPKGVKSKIGYLPELPPLYPDMTVRKYLEFMYDLKRVKLDKEEHIDEVCRLVKIDNVEDRIIKNLSKGYKQRVGFAQALLGNPPVLILDEPTVGLDPKQIIEIRNLIKNLGEKHTVILSSHILPEVQAVCDRIIIISAGKIVADAPTNELAGVLGKTGKLRVQIKSSKSKALDALNSVREIKSVKTESENADGTFSFVVEADTDVREAIFRKLSAEGLPMLTLESADPSLEEIFLKLTNASSYTSGKEAKQK